MHIDAERDALIVVDLQPDFMPGGALAVAGGDEIAAPIGVLAKKFTIVVATQDNHPPGHISFASSHAGKKPFDEITLYGKPQTLWPDHCVQGTPGAALHSALADERITMIQRKGIDPKVDSYSGIRENYDEHGKRPTTGLAGWLKDRGVKRVFVCGLARDFCVKWTSLDAVDAGFEVKLLDDLTRAVAPANFAATDAEYDRAGVQRISSTEIE